MSDSNRGILAAFAGIAALAVATGAGAFYGSVYAPEKRYYQSVGPNSGQSYPKDSPRNGLADASGIDTIAESLVANPQPRNTNEREQRELAAQESMAVFSYWMFWAMMLQTFFAAGALFALIQDLRQNRRSAEAQLRAYVSADIAGLSWNFEKGRITANFILKNGGQTPAYKSRHAGGVFIRTDEEARSALIDDKQSFNGTPIPTTIQIGGKVYSDVWSSDAIAEDDFLEITEGEKKLYAWCIIFYEDTFGTERVTRVCYYTDDFRLPSKAQRELLGGGLHFNGLWRTAPFYNDST
jgi:hypothetical protein